MLAFDHLPANISIWLCYIIPQERCESVLKYQRTYWTHLFKPGCKNLRMYLIHVNWGYPTIFTCQAWLMIIQLAPILKVSEVLCDISELFYNFLSGLCNTIKSHVSWELIESQRQLLSKGRKLVDRRVFPWIIDSSLWIYTSQCLLKSLSDCLHDLEHSSVTLS